MRNLKQQGSILVLAIVVLVLVMGLLVGIYLVGHRTNPLPQAVAPSTVSQTINTPADLESNLKELDSTNLDQMDQDLNQNNSDAATF